MIATVWIQARAPRLRNATAFPTRFSPAAQDKVRISKWATPANAGAGAGKPPATAKKAEWRPFAPWEPEPGSILPNSCYRLPIRQLE